MKVRYLIKFSKEGEIKFISHLDLMRTIQRVIRRAVLPIEYSKGFNPHMGISIAQPLSVGMYSTGDYMDVVLTEVLEDEFVKNKLNENAPQGVRIIDVAKVEEPAEGKKVPQAMALIDAAKYRVQIRYNNTDNLKAELDKMSALPDWTIMKKSKSGEKLVNIKEMVHSISFDMDSNKLTVEAVVSCGSKENLSAELLAQFIKINTTEVNEEAFVDIKREEMYVRTNNKLVSLIDYVR